MGRGRGFLASYAHGQLRGYAAAVKELLYVLPPHTNHVAYFVTGYFAGGD